MRELEEAIRDAQEGLRRIGRMIDQGNLRVAREFASDVIEDLDRALVLPERPADPLASSYKLMGLVPAGHMPDPLTRALAVVGELYVRWEPGAETPEERDIYHEAARLLFQFHPCERCRVFWSDRGYACPDHRVALGALPR